MYAKSMVVVALVASVALAVAGCGSSRSGSGVTAAASATPVAVTPSTTPVRQGDSAPSTPAGNRDLCFDTNSALANTAVRSLGPPPVGGAWKVEGGSTDPASAGCDGVLSYLVVDWNGIHPGTHVLFFADGAYLGTATAKPFPYTEVLGKTRNTVSVRYRWAEADDPLCCPKGGPSTVTFTLSGNTVRPDGRFPPN
ncbi:LppP/LprE family lipoprotein [Nocardia terpenica]|uniref:LppP/LprE family lipoprotein n=1 Tax=Nocardia terpenica TaxID=455432 RepID=A0A6G9Z8T2_9NOCA|nr:LppP/LprE family lipoprotein [Nocardia terpenica]QIS22035.1 LppP/LprE family lipoprotein [Nocardia terpenica]